MESQLISNIVSIVAAVIGVVGIWLTYSTLIEMKEQRFLSIKPNIDIVIPEKIEFNFKDKEIIDEYFNKMDDLCGENFCNITVKNNGNGVAKELKVAIQYKDYKCINNKIEFPNSTFNSSSIFDLLSIEAGECKVRTIYNIPSSIKDDVNIEKGKLNEIRMDCYISYKDIQGTKYECSYKIKYKYGGLWGSVEDLKQLMYIGTIECNEDNVKYKNRKKKGWFKRG